MDLLLKHLNDKTLYPITHPQKRIWYNEKIYPGTSIHNIVGYARIKGNADINMLEKSVNLFIQKTPGIRLRIVETDDEVYQYVSDFEPYKLEFYDFTQYEDADGKFEEWAERKAREPFGFEGAPLYYFAGVKCSDNEIGIVAIMHHIVSDGWSAEISSKEVFSIYSYLANGRNQMDENEYSYLEYIEKENQYISSEVFKKDRDFWKKRFEKLPDFLYHLPQNGIKGKRTTFKLEEAVIHKIKSLGYSANIFFSALMFIYQYKFSGSNDLVLGIPIFNRSGVKQKKTFGMFTSTMPFRAQINEEYKFLEFISYVAGEMKICLHHQKYPYDLIIQDLELSDRGVGGLFNIAVNYYNTSFTQKADDLQIEFSEFYNGFQFYDLQLVIREWGSQMEISFDYKNDLYSDKDISAMFGRLLTIIDSVYQNPNLLLRELHIMSQTEITNIIYEFNNKKSGYPKNKTIIKLFEEQVERTPGKVAVSFENEKLTYRELNELSNRFAWSLLDKGLHTEDIVGVLVEHSPEMFIGILGILKAGCAYLPIDPAYPEDRIDYMLEDSGATVLVTDCCERFNESNWSMHLINIKNTEEFSSKTENPGEIAQPDSLVYVIYTSGSTGKPKGTMIEHQGLVNYIWWAKKMYVKDEKDVFAVYSSLAFDLTVTSIFTPLISGIEAAIYRDDQKSYVLFRIIRDNRATIIKLTPSHLSLIKDMDKTDFSVKRFIVGGEDLKASLAEKTYLGFDSKIEIFNEYGPTETVVGCMIHQYRRNVDKDGSVPIGIPADNVMIYILDKNLFPVIPGQTGELFVSGDGVARGYLNKPEVTEERFIDNHFVKGLKMYRTGDLACFNDEGLVLYKGRSDFQVKIRGARIELGEIEFTLERFQGIKQAVVTDLRDDNGDLFLCAYVSADGELDLDKILRFLHDNLTEHMVPRHIIKVDSIPLSPNGKVDRSRLPVPDLGYKSDPILPQREIEKKIAEVFVNVLACDRIGIDDGFYTMGGDSIKAIQASSKLLDMGINISAGDIIKHQTIIKILNCVEWNSQQTRKYNQTAISGEFTPTPVARWFFDQNFSEKNYYNQSVLLLMKKDFNEEQMSKAFDKIIEHHDGLRLNFNFDKGVFFYNNKHLDSHFQISWFNISDDEAIGRKELAEIGEQMKSGFDIGKDLLIKAAAIKNSTSVWLFMTAHHLVMDGISWRILVEHLFEVYSSGLENRKLQMPLKSASMLDWQLSLTDYENKIRSDQKIVDYWNSKISDCFVIAADFDGMCGAGCDIAVERGNLGDQLTQLLLKDCNKAFGTETVELLLSALYICIGKVTGCSTIPLELEGHGRNLEEIDVSKTVGWFTSLYPVILSSESVDMSDIIMDIKENIRNIPDQGLSYGVLRYYSNILKKVKPVPGIRFNYLGQIGENSENEDYAILREYTGIESSRLNHATAKLEMNCMVLNGDLQIELNYCKNEFRKEKVKEILDAFIYSLRDIIDYTTKQEDVFFTPSDFKIAEITSEDLSVLFD